MHNTPEYQSYKTCFKSDKSVGLGLQDAAECASMTVTFHGPFEV